MLRAIKKLLIRLWVWLTPQAARNQITSEFMREVVRNPPKFASNVTQPLFRRVSYPDAIGKMFQVQRLPPGALPIYDKESAHGDAT
jgi:hypothetical protein